MALSGAVLLSTPGVTLPSRVLRQTLGAMFRPAAAALTAQQGALAGPAGTQGELTLLTDTLVRVNPAVFVINGTHNTKQGQYVVPNDELVDLAVPAKDASQFRRAYIAVRVADSTEAGVAPGPATDIPGVLEVQSGPLAASNPALPPVTPNTLYLGELSIPSTASGQPTTITRYAPRTTMRGGILAVADDTSTVVGHAGAPGLEAGEYRHHPLYNLQRWNTTAAQWQAVSVVEMTSAERQAIPAADRFRGMLISETDTELVVRWTGTAWKLLTGQHWATAGVVNNTWSGTVYGWVAGLGAKQVIPADGIRRDWEATITSNTNGDGWWRYRMDLAAGNGKAASTTYWPNTTGFRWIVPNETGNAFAGYGTLLGDQAATFYLEARATAAGGAGVVIPHVRIRAGGDRGA